MRKKPKERGMDDISKAQVTVQLRGTMHVAVYDWHVQIDITSTDDFFDLATLKALDGQRVDVQLAGCTMQDTMDQCVSGPR